MVRIADTIRPPTAAIPIGCVMAATLPPKAMAKGIWATTEAKVARAMGWNLVLPAVIMAERLPIEPLRSSLLASSSNRMALFTTTPISITIAMRAIMESALPVNIRARNTPMAPIGMVVMMIKGCAKLSSRATSKI